MQTKAYAGWQNVQTLQSMEIFSELIDAKENRRAKLLISDTGLGKSHVIKMFHSKMKSHTYVITVGDSFKLIDVLDEILIQMGIYKEYKSWQADGRIRNKLSLIVSTLKNISKEKSKPIIIIDEAENLKANSLRMMKELYDAIIEYSSLVLIGTHQIIETIFNTRRRNRTGVPQLWRRFKAGKREITPLDKMRDFKPFFNLYISDELHLQDLLIELCENYGELHDYLEPVLNHAYSKNEPVCEKLFRLYHKLPQHNNLTKVKRA